MTNRKGCRRPSCSPSAPIHESAAARGSEALGRVLHQLHGVESPVKNLQKAHHMSLFNSNLAVCFMELDPHVLTEALQGMLVDILGFLLGPGLTQHNGRLEGVCVHSPGCE